MKRTALALVAAGALIVAGCSGDDDDDEATGSTASGGTAPDEQGTQSEAELVADATTVAVAYFEARAVHDFDTADDNAEGAADLVIDWDEAVAGIDGLEGTPYEVTPVEAPEVRVSLSGMEEGPDGTYAAEGFIELGHRPSGAASTTTTTPPEGAEDLGETTFVTDLEFVRDGDTLRVTDYRFDDVPYPVSELYVAGESEATGADDGSTTTTAADEDATTTESTTPGDTPDEAAEAEDADVEITMGHRDVDGSVQWLVDHDDDAELLDARFIEGEEPPAAGEEGVPLDVYPAPGSATGATTGDDDATEDDDEATDDADDGDDGPDADALVVHAGAFPGLPGTLRFQVGAQGGVGEPLVVDARVLEFPELGQPRPTNVIRDQERDVDDTTTTTEPEESTTTTEPEDEVTTTTAGEVTTTTMPTTSTTEATTTTTTEAP